MLRRGPTTELARENCCASGEPSKMISATLWKPQPFCAKRQDSSRQPRKPFLSRTFVQLAYILVDLDPTESLHRRACHVTDSGRQSTPYRFRRGIKIHCLVALGATQEALLRFNALKRLYEQFREPIIQLRSQFTAARILEHLGRGQKAESLFQEVIAGDLEHGLVKELLSGPRLLVRLLSPQRANIGSDRLVPPRRSGALPPGRRGRERRARARPDAAGVAEPGGGGPQGNSGTGRDDGAPELHQGPLENPGERAALVSSLREARRGTRPRSRAPVSA